MIRARVVANRELGGGYSLLTLESPFGPAATSPYFTLSTLSVGRTHIL